MKYKYIAAFTRVYKVEVVEETETMVTYINSYGEPSKSLKETDTYKFFDTFEEAKAHVLDVNYRELEKAKDQVKYMENRIRLIKDELDKQTKEGVQ